MKNKKHAHNCEADCLELSHLELLRIAHWHLSNQFRRSDVSRFCFVYLLHKKVLQSGREWHCHCLKLIVEEHHISILAVQVDFETIRHCDINVRSIWHARLIPQVVFESSFTFYEQRPLLAYFDALSFDQLKCI